TQHNHKLSRAPVEGQTESSGRKRTDQPAESHLDARDWPCDPCGHDMRPWPDRDDVAAHAGVLSRSRSSAIPARNRNVIESGTRPASQRARIAAENGLFGRWRSGG